jgi:hypothetical protein
MKSEASFALPTRLLAALLSIALLSAMTAFAPMGKAEAQESGQTVGALPVSGELEDGGDFEGTVSNLEASAGEGDEVILSGVLDGTATQANGETTQIEGQEFSEPVALQEGASCDILFLDLGPLFLDLLGLEVNLDPVVLDVNAIPGAGNLLGNLLCAVTGLLDGAGALFQIVDLLNRIFDLLEQ